MKGGYFVDLNVNNYITCILHAYYMHEYLSEIA